MKGIIAFAFLLLTAPAANCQQIQQLLVNKYWQYSNAIYSKEGKHVYNFKAIPGRDSVKEVAMYFEANGNFREIVNPKTHPKPARSGKWQTKGDTVVIDFPNQRWYYKILFMNAKEFQCTMTKAGR